MKILHVIPNLPLTAQGTVIGGAASSAWTLAQHQTKKHEVSILGNVVVAREHMNEVELRGIRIRNLRVGSRRRTLSYGAEFLLRAAPHPAFRRSDIDILHFHAGFLEYFPVAMLLHAISHKPMIYTAYCPAAATPLPRLLIPILIRRGTRRVLLNPISENVRSYLRQMGVADRKMRKVPIALDTRGIRASGTATPLARRRFGLPKDDPVVLFVGNLRPEKNLVGLVHSMAKVVETYPQAVLCATTELENSTDVEVRGQVEAAIKAHGLEANVRFMGIVDNMAGLMSAADVCVFPFLHTEGPSDYFVASLEAMALAKPVVVSSVGGMPEVVDDKVGRLVDPLSEDQVAESILSLLGDAELRKRLGTSAQRRVALRFDVNKISARIEVVYQELLSND